MTQRKNDEAKNLRVPSTAFLDVLRKHLAIFTEHYRQPISELSVVAYAEDLAQLSSTQLDKACIEARRTSEFMPVSAAILAAHKSLQSRDPQLLGLRMEWNEDLEKERIGREKAFKQLLANGGTQEPEKPPAPKPRIQHAPKSAEEQKEEMRKRGWIQ